MVRMWTFCYVLLVVTTAMLFRPVSTASADSNSSFVCRPNADFISTSGVKIEPSLEKYEAALLMLLGFGGFSVFLAILYNLIRHYVYHDVNNVDSTFDAGGDVSSSLTAVTIAAQLLWPADLMQGVTFAVKYGIAGAFWYCGAAMLNLSLFPLLSFKFKSRAPGAKTFLQIIYARFGGPTHLIFCFFSLLVNFIVISTILVGGIAVMQATIKDVSPEFCLITIVTLCGSYSLIGGLGSTFYVSYFNALVTFLVLCLLIIKIIYSSDGPFGSLSEIYQRVNCIRSVDGNVGGSRFTFLSEPSVLVCIQSIFLVASITYCDQASWQSRIAAKPLQGAIGFLFGSFVWFSVPASIGLVTGLTYVSEAAVNGSMALSLEQIDSGITSTYMAHRALGTGGVVMMLTMITMLTMSTGSGEIMGVSAIIIYDIYQTYVNPFRKSLSQNQCIICGNLKANAKCEQNMNNKGNDDSTYNSSNTDAVCKCPPAINCTMCKKDLDRVNNSYKYPGRVVVYQCPHHSHFRQYQDSLINFKNWCLLWVSLALIPIGLTLFRVGIDLNWLMNCGAIMAVPSFPGVIMSVTWSKVTAKGLMIGSIVGFICGMTTNILVATLHFQMEGGFFVATTQPYSVVGGSSVAGTVSLVLTTVISLCTHGIKTPQDEEDVWERLRNLDNPLHPWSAIFAGDFPEVSDGITRPTQQQLEYLGRTGKLVSIGGTIGFLILFIIIIPGSMTSLEVLSSDDFRSWTLFITAWLTIAAIVIIIVTPTEEIYLIVKTIRGNSKSGAASEKLMTNKDGIHSAQQVARADFIPPMELGRTCQGNASSGKDEMNSKL